MSSTETPERGRSKSDAATGKIAIGLVAVLALLALVVGLSSGSGSKSDLIMSTSVPTKVSVPSIAATSSLISLGQNGDGTLSVPSLKTPMQASWYDKSPTPGQLGPAVVLGHVNGNGQAGIFADLKNVQPGDQVMVDRQDGQTAVFTVSRVSTVKKDEFPTQAVYGDTPGAELRLITCGGEYDAADRNYLSNVVVFANLTSFHRT